MATITSTSERITISGEYKAFSGAAGSTSTVIQFSSGDAPASGDAGRFLLWQNTADTGAWEVRFIESATSTTVTVTDGGFSRAPAAGEDFVISTNLADVDAATADSVMRSQGSSYQMRDRDFELTAGAFLADVNASLSTESTQTGSGFIPTYPVANGCVLQFGRLIGGEANDSIETIGGCQIIFEVANNTLMFTNQGSVNTAGPVLNFYGCLIESIANNGGLPFIRAPGALRIIGCVADGPMGGRLYSEESELVDTRFSGNTSGGVAWSLGGSFIRPIDNTFFFQNDTAIKAFQSFTGVFTNVKFAASNANIINSDGAQSGLLFSFIDCTTFADGDITADNGQYEQLKSINYAVTDANGTGLSGVKVAVYDTVGDVQGGVETSSSGAVSQINARFFRKDHGATAVNKAPFDIRIRKYGYTYLGFQSSVAEPIKQEVRLADNAGIVLSKADATALTGIDIDFGTSTLTITSDHGAQNLYDYYQRQLEYDASLAYAEEWSRSGSAFDLAGWDLVVDGATYTGDMTTTGTITLLNSGLIVGTATDASGTSTVSTLTLTGLQSGSLVRVYTAGTSTELAGTVSSGTSFSANISEPSVDIVVHSLEYIYQKIVGADTSSNLTLPIDQEFDKNYDNSATSGATFDGANLYITLPTIGAFDAQTQIYSLWKEWVYIGTNAQYPVAFDTTGGDSVGSNQEVAPYFFCRNDLGWRIKMPSADGEIIVSGNLFPRDPAQSLFEQTAGYDAFLRLEVSTKAVVIGLPYVNLIPGLF